MKFFLMRHGEAEAFAKTDRDRKLTDQGETMIRERITALRASLSDIDCIVHSPYIRAHQTAHIVAELIGIDRIQNSELWIPEGRADEALSSVESFINSTPLFVTHMPLISQVEALCVGDKGYPYPFSCGEIAVMHADWPASGLGYSKRY
ncbi:SixA phosphatase family protein [Neptuniibacter sp.]|uniref:SixA phosphatase family protein n=1 Tax=Neptuniibacter sp. TaxID=1962643 RepID=UPI003B5B64DE